MKSFVLRRIPMFPIRISVCTASGLSTTTTRLAGLGRATTGSAGISRRGQSANAALTAAIAPSTVTSPTTARRQLFGT